MGATANWLVHPERIPGMIDDFIAFTKGIRAANVLEMGVCRSNPSIPTMHRTWAADDANFIGTDFQAGLDVDVVADAHCLSLAFPLDYFDVIISVSIFEHIQYPWIAAAEVAKILKPGGRCFIHVPWMFPFHGFPNDYFRYSKEGLRSLFEPTGLVTIALDYEAPCRVVSEVDPGLEGLPAFSATRLVAEKPL